MCLAAYVSGSAHSPAKTPTGIDLIPNPSLPRRLLPSAGLPDRARLNIYCKPKYLGILVQLLKGSETWSSFLASQFWKLFELHVARCFHSAKLIQGMLSRQLLTQRKHERPYMVVFLFASRSVNSTSPLILFVLRFHLIMRSRITKTLHIYLFGIVFLVRIG